MTSQGGYMPDSFMGIILVCITPLRRISICLIPSWNNSWMDDLSKEDFYLIDLVVEGFLYHKPVGIWDSHLWRDLTSKFN